MSKVSILQRLIVSMPFSRLVLSLQFFSTDAQDWWNVSSPKALRPIPGKAPAIKAISSEGDKPKTVRKSKPSIKDIADSHKEKQLLDAGYARVEKPDLSGVKTVLRVEGVDGARLARNQGLDAAELPGIGPIEVDDGEDLLIDTVRRGRAGLTYALFLNRTMDRKTLAQMGSYRRKRSIWTRLFTLCRIY
jgi:hypothetical protein